MTEYYNNKPIKEITKIYNDGFLSIDIVKMLNTGKEMAFLIIPFECRQVSNNIASFISFKCSQNRIHGYALIDKLSK
jgi:hypothetical protein